MINHVIYDEADIDKFIEIDDINDLIEGSKVFEKLISVQDKISLIANIEPDELRVITYNLKFIQYNYKDKVIEEGDQSKEIFYILSGECQVFVQGKKVGVLTTGTTFGETAAIFNTKRNATVVCSSQTATVLSFCIDHDNLDFCAAALATLYKNLASQLNTKLEQMNANHVKK